MNLLHPHSLGKIAAIFSVLLFAASPGFAGLPSVTVQIKPSAKYGSVSPNYNGLVLTNNKIYSMTARAKSGYKFAGWIYTNVAGVQTNFNAKLSFSNDYSGSLFFTANFTEMQKPTLTVKTPPNSTALTNPAIVVTGTAKDNDAVAGVFYNLNGQGWQAATTGNGWSNWWANLTLNPNINPLLVYAIDRSGNCSKTNKLNLTYAVAPASLSGTTLTVTKPDTSIFTVNFASGTFSEDTGVGTYTYKKAGAVTGNLILKYAAPPSAATPANNVAVLLTFADPSTGTFKDSGGLNSFSLSTADLLAPDTVAGAQIFLTSSNNNSQSLLVFLDPPQITDNGHLGVVANPLVVSLSAQYPGNIGDRATVTFSHQRYVNDTWVDLTPQIYPGTVIDYDTSSNTVTLLFDSNGFVTSKDAFAPIAGQTLNIQTYYYTNYSAGNFATNGTGTFTYTNYSPVGSLLQLSQSGTNGYYILTFTSSSDSGNYFVENYGLPGNIFQGSDAGAFAIALPPLVSTQPQNAAVTNGGTATFTVTVAGTPPLNYQWQLNGTNLNDGASGSGSTISGSLSNLLTISAVSTNDLGKYRVIGNNSFGSVTSQLASLSFAIPPQITSQPINSNPTNGGAATFNVTATGSQPLAYQWQFNVINQFSSTNNLSNDLTHIAGALTNNLIISSVTTNDIGYYQVIITNLFGSVTSTPAAYLNISP